MAFAFEDLGVNRGNELRMSRTPQQQQTTTAKSAGFCQNSTTLLGLLELQDPPTMPGCPLGLGSLETRPPAKKATLTRLTPKILFGSYVSFWRDGLRALSPSLCGSTTRGSPTNKPSRFAPAIGDILGSCEVAGKTWRRAFYTRGLVG